MARIRSLKPTFWTDPSVSRLSRDARLLLVGLISFADDKGRFVASVNAISGYVFPHDNLPANTVRKWRDQVAKSGVIEVYNVDGCEYGSFPNWGRHQRISHPAASLHPPPPPSIRPEDVRSDSREPPEEIVNDTGEDPW